MTSKTLFAVIGLAAFVVTPALAAKKHVPETAGTFPTDGGTFVWILTGVVIIVGALTFFPAVALGPLAEHLQMYGGKLY